MAQEFKCLECQWQGTNVEYEKVETCMGADKTEMCPECGSISIVPVFKKETEIKPDKAAE